MAHSISKNWLHLIFSTKLNPQKSLSQVVKQLKGASSFQINQLELLGEKFAWQKGYAAYSVSESQLEKVRDYISHQEQHHLNQTFEQEYERFMKLHQINTDGEDI